MSDPYQCECGETHYSYSALMHCQCQYEDKYGRVKPIKGGDFLP